MEVHDPFAPAYQPDEGIRVDLPEQWMSPFPAQDQPPTPEPDAPAFGSVETPVASTPTDAPAGGLDRGKQLAEQLSSALKELQTSLDAADNERTQSIDERNQLQEKIRELEVEASHKRRFTDALTTGAGASITSEDLAALQSLTDALNADPDRLTVLFNVVQQASKLASVVSVYTQLRQTADEV